MRKPLYNLIDKKGKIKFSGTWEECAERQEDMIVYSGKEIVPIYRATNENNKVVEGTMEELSKKFKCSKINLYNYTRYKRKSDGLFLERIR